MKTFFRYPGKGIILLTLLFSLPHFLMAQISVGQPIELPLPTSASSNGEIRFIENKNQWDQRVTHKLEMQNGALFFEKNALTYSLLKSEDLEALEQAKHGEITGALPNHWNVNAHAFKVKFMNASHSVNVAAENPYSDYRNYYIG